MMPHPHQSGGLLQREALLAYQRAFRKDVYTIFAGIEVFLHIPVDSDGLFFTGVLNVFLDGVRQLAVLVGKVLASLLVRTLLSGLVMRT